MHHWSSVNQQPLALQVTLLPVLPNHKAFPMGGLSCEPSDWSAEHSWARCTYKTWNWCVARSRDGKVVHVGLCFAVSSWHWRDLLGEGWSSSMEVLRRSCSMGAHVGRTEERWKVMGQVKFGLWSVLAAEMPDFNLGLCCCPVSNALCFVFQLYSCKDGHVGCHSILPVGNIPCLNSWAHGGDSYRDGECAYGRASGGLDAEQLAI